MSQQKQNHLLFNPTIWGPKYWFFLHTIAMCYPNHPNAVTKKKYYEFIQNIPMFIPVENMANDFSKLLDEYPVTPYLDDRESFIRWVWFIHNKINEKLEKPKITLNDFYVKYYEEYKTTDVKMKEYYKTREKIIYASVIVGLLAGIYYLYDK
jgi:FAD-linked sulfhydryl oxidase